MDTERLHILAHDIYDAMGTKLSVSGPDLHTRTRRAGRALPRRLRRELDYVSEALELSKNPRFLPRIDMPRCEDARHEVLTYLDGIDPREWRRSVWRGIAVNVALAVLVGAGVAVLLLM